MPNLARKPPCGHLSPRGPLRAGSLATFEANLARKLWTESAVSTSGALQPSPSNPIQLFTTIVYVFGARIGQYLAGSWLRGEIYYFNLFTYVKWDLSNSTVSAQGSSLISYFRCLSTYLCTFGLFAQFKFQHSVVLPFQEVR